MVCKYSIILLVGLLISSCAQVGVISGGEVDRFAPKPVADKVVPLNESTNFQGNTVEIPFDEYFRLVNPTQNIRMVPPHATVVASIKNKTLTLTWEDTLESNTTYAIYLNEAIKDLNEGNDTIIQYVFSTGPALDTLSYSVSVIDAWTNESIDNCIVALFDNDKLVSFAKPDNGIAKLNYLKPGNYNLVAFNDENNDLELQEFEKVAFPETGRVIVNQSWFDSVPLRMFAPKADPRIRTLDFNAPGAFTIGTTVPIQNTFKDVFVNGESVLKNTLFYYAPDSLIILTDKLEGNKAEVVVQTEFFTDTMTYRFRPKELDRKILITNRNKGIIKPSETAYFTVNSKILSVDSTKIKIENIADSTLITDFEIVFGGNQFDVRPINSEASEIKISLDSGAVTTICGASLAFVTKVSYGIEREFGVLNVDVSGYQEPIIVDLLQNNKLITSTTTSDPSSTVVFEELLPGEYSFRVIRDSNGNGMWDIGEYATLKQPEVVDVYSKKTKVRANWTVDVTLTPIY